MDPKGTTSFHSLDLGVAGTLLDSVSSLVVVTDASGAVVQFNEACETLSGFHTAEVQGQPLLDLLVPDEEHSEVLTMARGVLESGTPAEHTNHWRTRTGERHLIRWSNRSWQHPDGSTYLVSTGTPASPERERLARELHDGLRQQLVGLRMLAVNHYTGLVRERSPQAVTAREFMDVLAEANLFLRDVLQDLAPSTVTAAHFTLALERLARNIQRWYGIDVEVVVAEGARVPSDHAAHHLLFITQEAVTNAAKHSRADRVTIDMRCDHAALTIRIRDDGVGLPSGFERSGGVGIAAMRSRASALGARLEFSGDPTHGSGGTTVTCTAPGNRS